MNNESNDLVKALNTLIKNTRDLNGNGSHELATSVVPTSTSYGVPNTPGGTVHLRDYWRAIRKHLGLVIGITALTVALSTIYMARKPDIYEASARVQVDLENVNPAISTSKNGSIVFASGNDPVYFNTQLEILTGSALLRRVVKMLDLEHNRSFLQSQAASNRSTGQSLLRMFGLGGKDKDDSQNQAAQKDEQKMALAPATAQEDLNEVNRLAPYVATLQGILTVKQIKGTRMIEIRCAHPDQQVAAKVANTIANAFVYANLEKRTESTNTTGDFLQKRIAELQSQIRTGEEQLINYAKNNQILSLDASQNTVVDRLAGLNKQLLEAENERKIAEAAYRQSLVPGAADVLADTDAKQINELENKLAELKQKRAQLLVENTEEWPEVKEVNQQIAVLEKQVKDFRERAKNNIKGNLEIRYRQALAREAALRDAFNKQRGETLTQNEAAINYRIIQQEIETNKTLLDGLLQRSKENDVVLAGTPNNIHVADYAAVPKAPIGPKRLQFILLALVLSLAGGIALALLLEYLDDSIRSTDDVEEFLKLPALAVIPSIGGLTRRRLLPAIGALQARKGGEKENEELLINADARSALAESYRQLRTSVLLSTAGRAPRTLVVTSSLPGEGKTTTSVNTAISLVQTGAKVLVIDADMRRPRLHSIFNIANRDGLSTILSRSLSEAEILNTVQQHQGSGLYLLPSGAIPPNPAELLASEQMHRLLAVLEATFTHVVIDSPPVANFTDGAIISSLVDGVLLVIHGGKSSRGVVRRSQQILHDVGAKIFGVVLNNVNISSQDYYYYQKYYNHYYYQSEVDAAESSAQV